MLESRFTFAFCKRKNITVYIFKLNLSRHIGQISVCLSEKYLLIPICHRVVRSI